jgi:hypothetical protein
MSLPLPLARLLALFALFSLAPLPVHAASYLVSVNTAAFAGASGAVDLQFNPAGGALPATASVSLASGLASLGAATLDGAAAGGLAGTVTLVNTTAFNALLQDVVFGSSFGFRLDVDVAPGASAFATTFGLGLYDETLAPFPGAQPDGFVLTIDFFGAADAIISAASGVTVTPVNAIPEPASALLLLAGLLALAWARRGRRASGH